MEGLTKTGGDEDQHAYRSAKEQKADYFLAVHAANIQAES